VGTEAHIEAFLNTSGTTAVDEGWLTLWGGGALTGEYFVAADTELDMDNGPFLAQGGAVADGNGMITVAGGVTLTVDGMGQQSLTVNRVGLTVNTGGTVLVMGGQITVSNAATITNNGTFELRGDNLGILAGGGGGSFMNFGSFLKTQSLLADTAPVNIAFTNRGTVQVQTGVLLFNNTLSQPMGGAVLNVQASGDGEIRGSNMTIWDGMLQGDGILRVKGIGATLTWGVAQMNGSGNVIVDTGATMILQKDFTDSGFTITNTNITRWTAGIVTLNNGATINNQAGAVFQVESDATMNNTGGAATFNNYGTFRKIAFPTDQQFGVTLMQVAFNSAPASGQGMPTIDVQFHGVRFQKNGTFQTTFSIAAGAKIDFSGGFGRYNLLDGTTFSGAGTARVTNFAAVVLADNSKVINSATFEFGGFDPLMPTAPTAATGTLMGSGVFQNTIAGTFNWRWGNIANVMEVDNQGVMNMGSEDVLNLPITLDSSVLKNEMRLNWTRGDVLQTTNSNPDRNSQIINQCFFDVQADGTLRNDTNPNRSGLAFLNQGLFQKSGGNATTTLQMPCTNASGAIWLLGRTVSFAGGLLQTGLGSILIANGTLQAPFVNVEGGNLDLGTNGAGTLTVPGGVSIAQGAKLSGLGTINGSVTNSATIDLGANGAPVGQLTISGDYTQGGSATLIIRLQQAQGQQYDRLQIGGTANLAGTLQFNALNLDSEGRFIVAAGDTFTILTYNQVAGDFNQPYPLPRLVPNRVWAPPALGAMSLVLTVQ
jgi:hypothetical protein